MRNSGTVAREVSSRQDEAASVPDQGAPTLKNGTPPGAADRPPGLGPTETHPTETHPVIYFWEYVFGGIVVVLWFLLFAGGMLINTQPYRDQIGSTQGFLATATNWVKILSFWTITNVGILCCLSALLGAFAVRTKRSAPHDKGLEAPHLGDYEAVFAYYCSALLRGFGLFIFAFAGLIVFATESMATPTQSEYMRLSIASAVASFYVGFDQRVFEGLLQRARAIFQQAPGEGPPKK